MRVVRIAIVAVAVAIPVGLAGAWAFNPDSGAVLHSTALWRIFGITAELGFPILIVLIIGGAIAQGIGRTRAGIRRP